MISLRQKLPFTAALGAIVICFCPSYVSAQIEVASEIEGSGEQRLNAMFEELMKTPNNLRLNYAYANLATQLEKYDEALSAFDRMLILNPTLLRVKLDMALVYMKAGMPEQASTLFDKVLAENPPEKVKRNIKRMKKVALRSMRRHNFSGTFAVGYNTDTNSNAAPGGGVISVVGIDVPLDDSSGRASDEQVFTALTLKHDYKIFPGKKHTWESSGTVYKSKQASLHNLDITSYSLRTGPRAVLNGGKTRAGITLGYDDVNLAQKDYLRTVSQQVKLDHIIHPKFKISGALKHESRRYRNTDTVTTYEARSGSALQGSLGANFVLSPVDILAFNTTLRKESTKTRYNDNRSHDLKGTYTRLLEGDAFASFSAGLKKTHYKGVDILVDPSIVRRDFERYYTLSLGKKLTDNWTASASYGYRDVSSNIQNYDYENERISANLSRSF